MKASGFDEAASGLPSAGDMFLQSRNTRNSPALGRVLIAEDDPEVLRMYATILRREGWSVETVADGLAALDKIRTERVDVLVSDLAMPGLDGMQLLRAIRTIDPDLPVLFVTASPSIASAAQAVEWDAFRYLVKPVPFAALSAAVSQAAAACDVSRRQRELLRKVGHLSDSDRTQLESELSRAIDSLWIAYQPIVRWSSHEVYAYEALVRSHNSTLPVPGGLLDAAEKLGRVRELGRAIRSAVVSSWQPESDDVRLFVNVHSAELADDELTSSDAPLSSLADQVVLEVTERASLDDVPELGSKLSALRDLGFRVAVDDLGAGYAGLTSIATLKPEILKLDMTLVRGIDNDPVRQRLVGSMLLLGRDLGQPVIAEGVETEAEREKLLELGCDYFQGFLFAMPDQRLAGVQW